MASKRRESGTRLPNPTGDYASPDTFSPSNSPPSSISSAMRPLSTTIPEIPFQSSSGPGTLAGALYFTTSLPSLTSGVGRPLPPPAQPNFVSASAALNRTASPTPAPGTKRRGGQGLPPPKSATGIRQTSTSPTPTAGARKRYAAALGGPITAPPDEDEFSSNAASFYVTAANTNANANIKESYKIGRASCRERV